MITMRPHATRAAGGGYHAAIFRDGRLVKLPPRFASRAAAFEHARYLIMRAAHFLPILIQH